jgi:uncharacterized membrane protein
MAPPAKRQWLLYCLLAIVIFGVWGVVGKAASSAADAVTLQVVSTAGLLPVSLLLLASKNLLTAGPTARPSRALGMSLGFAAGLCGGAGNLALLYALRDGDASAVYPLTGMYPLVTVFLAAVFLRERLNWVQVLGLVVAAGALYLFNAEGAPLPDADTAMAWWRSLVGAKPWMAYSLAALVLWGVLAVFQKVATRHISSELSTVCFAAAFVPVAAVLMSFMRVNLQLPPRGWALALLFGALLGVGTLVLFAAYRTGKASVVTALSALYPALTVMIAVPLFGEPLNWHKVAAVTLALAAAVALSYERAQPDVPRGFDVVTEG